MPAAIVPGKIPAATLAAAIADSIAILDKVYAECLPTNDQTCLDLIRKYYAAHLLYTWGFALPNISSSVGDVSTGKGGAINLGDKTGLSPYFIEFNKLLQCPEEAGAFITSI